MSESISLEVYAHVLAALGEGYPLAQILEHEGLSEGAWERGEEHWVSRIQDDLAIADELDRELFRARNRFARRISPLDDDLRAWLAYQRDVASNERPLSRLADDGLFLGDWVRLSEAWAERLSSDPALRTEAAAAAVVADALPPEIRPAPRSLGAPLLGRRQSENAPTQAEKRELDAVPWGLAEIVAEVPSDAETAHPETRITAPGARPTPSEEALGSAPAPIEAQLPSYLLPKMSRAADGPVERRSDPAGAGTVAQLRQTAALDLGAIARAIPLPFRPGSASSAPEDASCDASRRSAPKHWGTTAGLDPKVVAEARALPFRSGAGDARPPADSPKEAKSLGATANLDPVLLARGLALPFQRAHKALQETATFDLATMLAGSVVPSAGAAEPSPAKDLPVWSLEQHAAFHAELAFKPAERPALLARYCITEADCAQLDAHWWTELRRDASQRMAWEKARAVHLQRLAQMVADPK